MATPIPRNSASFTLSEIALATGGTLHAKTEGVVRGVVTDSRGDVGGALFVALPGERFDGHQFALDVVRRGAAAVLIERELPLPPETPRVLVASTLDALGALGRLHRRRWGGRIVAVAGSAGKTTTKGAINALCRALWPDRVYAAPGNLNNRIGVPMVLLGLGAEHRLAVIEVGTNQTGEVRALSQVCEPDVAVLTLIGLEHAEGLGDLDAIEAEEGALFSALREGGAAIANGDDFRARRRLEACTADKRVSYGTEPATDYRVIERRSRDTGGSTLLVERSAARGGGRLAIETSLLGLAGALSSVAALATAETLASLALEPALVSRALGEPSVGESGRLVPIELEGRVLVLDDSYNSNPPSLRSSLAAARELATARGSRLVLVVGEMRELGALSEPAHRELADELAQSGAAALVAVAGDAALFVDAARARGIDAAFVHDSEAALERVLGLIRTGDVVLVKASRGVRAERVVEGLVRARGKAA
jgi:UDP-N-acetylmuramoyl-tripeptide--D-alanyl-D-alanine ligase